MGDIREIQTNYRIDPRHHPVIKDFQNGKGQDQSPDRQKTPLDEVLLENTVEEEQEKSPKMPPKPKELPGLDISA